MEKTLISWNAPNVLTIWLMLAIGLTVFALVAQYIPNPWGGASATANNAGGY